MEELIEKYKAKIKESQQKRKYYESIAKGGLCLVETGKIQAYNAVISDLKRQQEN